MNKVFSKVQLAVKKKFSPKFKQEQIDVVTKLTTGKVVVELAEEALAVATTDLTNAEVKLEKKEEEYIKAEVELKYASINKDLRKKDFDTVADVLK